MGPERIEGLDPQPPPPLLSSSSSHHTGEIGLAQTPARPAVGFAGRLGMAVGTVVVAQAIVGLRFRARVTNIDKDGHGMDRVVLKWIAAEDGGRLVRELLPDCATRTLLLPKDDGVIVSVVVPVTGAAA